MFVEKKSRDLIKWSQREREREREREKRFCESRVSFAIFIIYLAIKKCMHRYYLQNVIGV